jgi:alpha-beta hydrolase superfamily lysophospholipase
MGGLGIAAFALRAPPELAELAGVVLVAPWLSTRPGRLPGPLALAACRALAWICPALTADTGIRPENDAYPDACRRMVRASPRFNPRATIGLLVSVVAQMRWVAANWDRFPDVPALFVQAMDDNCVVPAENLRLAHRLATAGRRLARVKVFASGSHDPMKTRARRETIEELLRFFADAVRV